MKKPELLSPAGTFKNMCYAFGYGADAVYAGQPKYSLRVRNNDFNRLENLANGIEYAHKLGKQFYIASNIQAHNNKVRSYLRDMEAIIQMQPDALIMSDPGLIMMVRDKWPDMPVHLSVQANAVNYASVKFWGDVGLSRVILSRELSLDEIEEIRNHCPEMELEVFVHGALCIAYSGRCLLSGYMSHRDSNQGACTNSCRWKYQAHEAKEDENGELIPKHPLVNDDIPEVTEPSLFLLQEAGRPKEYMPAFEDEHGTYIMNSKDLRAVQHVDRLTKMGINSLKIEGRTKSHYYVARTAQVYRWAIDQAAAGKEFDVKLMAELEKLARRGYTEGFYNRHKPAHHQNYQQGKSETDSQQFVGEVIEYDSTKELLHIDVKNRFDTGDHVELMTPAGNIDFIVPVMTNKKGHSCKEAPGSGHIVQIPFTHAGFTEQQAKFALLAKYI